MNGNLGIFHFKKE